MKKWGLALGGGGILGLAHIGVLQALEKEGLQPSVISGTSAGSVIAGLYASGVDFGTMQGAAVEALFQEDALPDVEEWLPQEALETAGPEVQILPSMKRSTLAASMAVSGLVGGGAVEAALDRVTHSARLCDARLPLSITSVDVITGEIVVFTSVAPDSRSCPASLALPGRAYVTEAKISLAIRASVSIPGIFRPKKFGKWSLVDGGVREMVPAFEARRMGAEEVIAVDLGLHTEMPEEAGSAVAILSRCFQLASRESTLRSLSQHASLTLQPEIWEIGFPTPSRCREMVQAGRACVLRNMPRILALLQDFRT